MKVVFLDIDGVLNSYKYMEKPFVLKGKNYHFIDKKNIANLKEIINKTNAVIVLSSTWRLSFYDDLTSNNKMGEALIYALKEANLSLYAMTPYNGIDRYQEIQEWLLEHPEVSTYIILDDTDYDWKDIKPYWIPCNPKVGLTKKDAKKAIRLLGEVKK
ncbi:hypothetical protein M2475_002033 [Breznakia sp. PF5-3]|uniref:HAD domain-containing protein n=1 Tax=unclassified Breznakia TaxID=2623764 RepID=UPI0024069600|nr:MULTISPECIES: HAD domain-containing protein [unclassified Breznakia]MDF9825634.1 hypothetical protein [Breznakia sp. PM6-1]MDF9836452.1 hypothetical protein [Breznakia sp. PF5-3]MDF9838635.1 hypothetical protein [Breznakia sp. PFB2-8]MDF9860666.1 hypothetical protein [Breznakia sp. PH5-24]